MALSGAERHRRWRERHRDEIIAKRDAERARTAARLARVQPWVSELTPLKALAERLRQPGGEVQSQPRSDPRASAPRRVAKR